MGTGVTASALRAGPGGRLAGRSVARCAESMPMSLVPRADRRTAATWATPSASARSTAAMPSAAEIDPTPRSASRRR
ncbi:hypothetical protein ABAZ39_27255 (plasmid) [Azospirillum argentinense]|uniref:Uncharacterized protein n=1 Tax=Azospirillum argentinense TaxID=2970906 RepID=A0A060DXI5_9PROT|nr:hypothetical protein ABAZ39_27255 [Azospirillum argentinense]